MAYEPKFTITPKLLGLVEGWDHTCGISTDGTALCWGYNEYGQTSVPQ